MVLVLTVHEEVRAMETPERLGDSHGIPSLYSLTCNVVLGLHIMSYHVFFSL